MTYPVRHHKKTPRAKSAKAQRRLLFFTPLRETCHLELSNITSPMLLNPSTNNKLHGYTMQIAVNLPNDFVAFQSPSDIEKDIRLSYSLWLFKHSRGTLSKAARRMCWACEAHQSRLLRILRRHILGYIFLYPPHHYNLVNNWFTMILEFSMVWACKPR